MEQGAFIAQFLAALFYVGVGVRLLRLSYRTREVPEMQLGVYFSLSGVAYLLWVLPILVNLGSVAEDADFAAWIVFGIGTLFYLIFVRRVFRPHASWAGALVYGCSAALAVGGGVLMARGEQYPGLGDVYLWLRWVGYTVPCAWITLEAASARRVAARRLRVGLSDPIVVNRYLLLGIFGTFQTLACFSDVLMSIDVVTDRSASALSDALLGGFEVAGIAALWLAFFPPARYRAWVSESAPAVARTDSGAA